MRSPHDLVSTALDLPDMPCEKRVTKRNEDVIYKYSNFPLHLTVMMIGMDTEDPATYTHEACFRGTALAYTTESDIQSVLFQMKRHLLHR